MQSIARTEHWRSFIQRSPLVGISPGFHLREVTDDSNYTLFDGVGLPKAAIDPIDPFLDCSVADRLRMVRLRRSQSRKELMGKPDVLALLGEFNETAESVSFQLPLLFELIATALVGLVFSRSSSCLRVRSAKYGTAARMPAMMSGSRSSRILSPVSSHSERSPLPRYVLIANTSLPVG